MQFSLVRNSFLWPISTEAVLSSDIKSGHWRVCHLYTALLTALTWGGWGEGGLVSVSCSEITLLGKSFGLLGLWILVKHIFVVSARVFS